MPAKLVDISWLLCLLAWLVASIWAIWEGNGDLLPRLGAVLVAVSVVYYAVIPKAVPIDVHTNKMILQLQKQDNLNSEMAFAALQNNATLAAALVVERNERSEDISKPIRLLAEPVFSGHSSTAMAHDWQEVYAKQAELSDGVADASDGVTRENTTVARWQAFFGALGTVQWGFGDLLA